MIEALVALLALAAGGFSVVAALGVVRFPDVMTRMHASSKVATFAGALGLLAAALWAGDGGTWLKVLGAIAMLYVTAPIGAHLIGRAAAWRQGLTHGSANHGKRLLNKKN